MKIITRIVFILTSLILLSNMSFPIDSHKHSRVPGFYVNNSPEPNGGNPQKIEEGKYEEFFENLPEAKKWMEDAGFNDQDKFVDKLEDFLERCLEAAIQRIYASKELSEKFKEEFMKNINGEGKFKIRHTKIVFKKDLKGGGVFIDAAFNGHAIDVQLNATIKRTGLTERHLKRIIDYLAKKLAQTKPGENPNFADAWKELKDFISTLMHELMHRFGRLMPDDDDSSKVQTKFECIIYCMEYLAFGIIYPGLEEDCAGHCDVLHKDCREIAGCKDKDGLPNKYPWKPDAPDDNYSYSEGNLFDKSSVLDSIGKIANDLFAFGFYPDVLIYQKFDGAEIESLLNRSQPENYLNDYVHDHFSNNHKILLVPSAELMGDENSLIVKQAFERFVRSGGTLLVLGQQYGEQFDRLMPIPDGETLTTIRGQAS